MRISGPTVHSHKDRYVTKKKRAYGRKTTVAGTTGF